jgi:hypothetical protein
MSTRLFACLLAAAVLTPMPHLALSADAGLRLPPISHIETIPWLTGATAPKTHPSLGLLLTPAPFTETPVFAAAPVPDPALLATRLTSNSRVE